MKITSCSERRIIPVPTPRELHIKEMQDAFKRGEKVEYSVQGCDAWWGITDLNVIEDDEYEYRINPEVRTVPEILEEINFRRDAYKKQFEELLGELTAAQKSAYPDLIDDPEGRN